MTTDDTTAPDPDSDRAAPNSADELAVQLAETIANLDAYIAAAADRIAQPRIAAAEAAAADHVAAVTGNAAADRTRYQDLETELRRQLRVLDRQRTQLRWLARYLPARLRALVLVDPPASRPDRWAGDRPDKQFAARVDEVAAEIGAAPYPPHAVDDGARKQTSGSAELDATLAHLPPDRRPAPDLAPYDQLMTRTRETG